MLPDSMITSSTYTQVYVLWRTYSFDTLNQKFSQLATKFLSPSLCFYLCFSPIPFKINIILCISRALWDRSAILLLIFTHILEKTCYQTELGSAHPLCSKANLLTLGCGEGKYSIYLQGNKKGEQAAHAQKTWTPQWLSGKGFKGNISGKGCSLWTLS